MRLFIILTILFFLTIPLAHADSLSDRLFAGSSLELSLQDKEHIASQTGVRLNAGGEGLQISALPVTLSIKPLELNGDQTPEILFLLSGPQFGGDGSAVQLFVKNAQGTYEMNLGFPAGSVQPLESKSQNYKDLQIQGAGFECTIWKWNGSAYAFSHKIACS